MEQGNKETYYAVPIENVEFSENELKRMGIVFLENLDDLQGGLDKLGVYSVDPRRELVDYGYALAQIGSLIHPYWVIYSINLNFEYVSDVWNRRNFYSVLKETENGTVALFDKVHLRQNYLEEDMSYYINLDLNSQSSQYPVHSEYVH